MGKTKDKSHAKQKDILRSTSNPLVKNTPKKSQRPIEDLLTEAAELLEQSQPDLALPLAEEALQRLEAERKHPNNGDDYDIDELLSLAEQGRPTVPTVLTLNAEIQLAMGDVEAAQRGFTRAVKIDPDGALVSAEPWLWLAQLCEDGGRESIDYYERAVEVLRNEIEVLEEHAPTARQAASNDEGRAVLDDKRAKLADALCAMAEVYMTDLSWEADAEQRCEMLVTEAVAVCPEHLAAGVLQTLASVRISQERPEDAKVALERSMAIWQKSPAQEGEVDSAQKSDQPPPPDFATRVSLCRLLMEVQLLQKAMEVLELLVKEDDQSVECWYLGGWCQVLISQDAGVDAKKAEETAKTWLENCLRLYRILDYEDERLRDHAVELVGGLKKSLGVEDEMDDEDDDDDDDEAWEDEDEEDDVELEVNGHPHGPSDGDVEMT